MADPYACLTIRIYDMLQEQGYLLIATITLLQQSALCVFRTTIAAITGETATAQALGNEALYLFPPDHLDIRARALNSLGTSYHYSGDIAEAAKICSEVGRSAKRVGNLYLAMAEPAGCMRIFIDAGSLWHTCCIKR